MVWNIHLLNSPNIRNNVNKCKDSAGNRKIRLKNFEESLVLYCQGVKEMESNICSKLKKISGQANETCDTAKDWNVSLNAKIEGTTKTNEMEKGIILRFFTSITIILVVAFDLLMVASDIGKL